MRRREGYISQTRKYPGLFIFPKKFDTTCILFVVVVLLSLSSGPFLTAKAGGVSRHYDEDIVVVITHWQLVRWQDAVTVCDLYLQHQSWPSTNDVTQSCGSAIAKDWQTTPPCQEAFYGGTGASCKGLLLRQLGESSYVYTRHVDLPEITMQVVVTNCTPGERCSAHPDVQIVATEPIAGYQITHVHVEIGDVERVYNGANATVHLPLTNDQGETLVYWAESNYGDQSHFFEVKFRALKTTTDSSYRFDLLNNDWASKLPAGALLWDIFPPSDGSLPKIFDRSASASDIATSENYLYLAGYLIRKGRVDAGICLDRGLAASGAASPCGEKVGIAEVLSWQNRYDQQIYIAAQRYNVPPQVLKAVIAQESQFIPESNDPYEQGLGHVTENGVNMLMLWNNAYYLSSCVPIYGSKPCSGGYSSLNIDQQTVIRRAAFNQIHTDKEIDLLAAMLYASAVQTRQMVVNVTHAEPAVVSTYEDMWKISIANYYSGSGCIGTALRSNLKDSQPFLWDNVSSYLPGDCQIAKDYVQKVLRNQ